MYLYAAKRGFFEHRVLTPAAQLEEKEAGSAHSRGEITTNELLDRVIDITNNYENYELKTDWNNVIAAFIWWFFTPFIIGGIWCGGVKLFSWVKEGFKEDDPQIIEDKEK